MAGQQRHVRECKREQLAFYFSNAAKTCYYGLKLSRSIEIKYLLHFKAYSHVFHTSCLRAFETVFRAVAKIFEIKNSRLEKSLAKQVDIIFKILLYI